MGQKVNPISLRLGYVENWKSNWMANKKNFVKNVIQDEKIRQYLNKRYLEDSVVKITIAEITIDRKSNQIFINIHTTQPGLLIGKQGAGIEGIRNELSLMTKSEVFVNVHEVNGLHKSAKLIAGSIGQQLVKRVSSNKVISQASTLCMRSGVQGVKIKISGRLDGAEMAGSNKVMEGRVPLHTIRAKIDYACEHVKTIYGIIGIKVWIYNGEVYDLSERYNPEKANKPARPSFNNNYHRNSNPKK